MAARADRRGYALRGTLWPGADTEEIQDGVVIVDGLGSVAAIGPALELPLDLEVIDVGWIGPGIIDAHVHMAFGSFDEQLRRGVLGVRDLGAPSHLLAQWADRDSASPDLYTAGQLLTAPDGYPSRSWGADGFGRFVRTEEQARAAVRQTLELGADLIKVALEPSGGAPVPGPEVLRAIVEEAHQLDHDVACHALSVEMVRRALDAGVDELCHMPIEALPEDLVEQIAAEEILVCSTLHTFVASGSATALDNARRLLAAGVVPMYGTDLGNYDTAEGIDTRELRLLAELGLGVRGALRCATELASQAPGVDGRTPGVIELGLPARMIALPSSPLTATDPWQVLAHPPLVALGSWLSTD